MKTRNLISTSVMASVTLLAIASNTQAGLFRWSPLPRNRAPASRAIALPATPDVVTVPSPAPSPDPTPDASPERRDEGDCPPYYPPHPRINNARPQDPLDFEGYRQWWRGY